MKISIARLKEIIVEEVARATAIEEEDVPGSEDYEKRKEKEDKEKEEKERRRIGKAMASSLSYGYHTDDLPLEETFNIEIVDDE